MIVVVLSVVVAVVVVIGIGIGIVLFVAEGDFYSDPGDPNAGDLNPAAVFDDPQGEKPYEYADYVDKSEAIASNALALDDDDVEDAGDLYSLGSPLKAGFWQDGRFVAAYGGALPLPAATYDGTCSEVVREDVFHKDLVS